MKKLIVVFLLLLFLLASSISFAELLPGSSALSRIMIIHPALLGGGATGESFASWANCQYLLDDAVVVGEIALVDDGVAGLVFIARGKAVLAFWSSAGQAATAHVDLLPGAFLYSRGTFTRKLAGKRADIAASALPQFVLNCTATYLAEGLTAEINETTATLSPLLQQLLPEDDFASWQTATEIKHYLSPSATEKYLQDQQKIVDLLLSTLLQLPAEVDNTLRSEGTWKLLCWRLRLVELISAYRELNGKEMNKSSLFPLEEQGLLDGYLHYLALAEPKTALRARPKSGMLLRNSLLELQRLQHKKSPQMQESLLFIYQIIPYFLAIESPVVQNLMITAEVKDNGLLLSLRNDSAEMAAIRLEFIWQGKIQQCSFEIAAAETTEKFILGDVINFAKDLQITGVLTDGTPLLSIYILVSP